MNHEDTIFALATPLGRSGVAVIRASGAHAQEGLETLSGRMPKPRIAELCVLKHPVSRETLDKSLVLYFENPASYTGENVVEYHVHGGRAVIESVLNALAELPNHRMAEAGEFTRRAFENGKMDLTEAEAVADLIDAETQMQKTQALKQMGGALYKLYHGWAESLKKSLAHLEADIEFPDEDMPEGVSPQVLKDVSDLKSYIEAHLNDNQRGERLRDGIKVAVIGAPNAGKSSLVNALAKRDVAIVSDLAGTTRDVIEVHLDLQGLPVMLMDTAGLRPEQVGEQGHDAIESEGVRRALERAENADIKILVFDGATNELDEATKVLVDKNSIVVLNKSDLSTAPNTSIKGISISAQTGDGLDELTNALTHKAQDLVGSAETLSLTRKRHRNALESCRESLARALNTSLPELVAEDVRLAVRALGRITGRVDVEDLLDVIFNDFCIGK